MHIDRRIKVSMNNICENYEYMHASRIVFRTQKILLGSISIVTACYKSVFSLSSLLEQPMP